LFAVAATAAQAGKAVSYVGKLNGGPTSARVAVVADGDDFIAYVCSSDDAFNQKASRWFKGKLEDGKFSTEPDGLKLNGAITASGLKGTLSGEEEMTFSAKATDNATMAGLFRAEFNDGEDDMIGGWIVDEEDEAVGAANSTSGKKKKTATVSKNENGVPNVSAKGSEGEVKGQRVSDPKNPPKGSSGRVITPELREELLARLGARATSRGATPVAGLVLQEARRFLAGEESKNKLEEKVFGTLRKVPKALLKQYVSDWDKVPGELRRKLVGAAALALDSSQPISIDLARKLLGNRERAEVEPRLGLPSLADPFGGMVGVMLAQQQSGAKGITSIDLKSLKCIDPTGHGKGKVNKDEIFFQAVISAGNGTFEKKSGIYRFKAGDSKNLSDDDARVFPGGGVESSEGDVVITVALFEDEVEDIKKAKDVIGKLSTVATAIVTAAKPALAEKVQTAAKTAEGIIDALGAALPQTALLGTETVVVHADGSLTDKDGKGRTKLNFQAQRKSGKLKFHYELAPITVK
jgi:hypothetical protein